MLLTAVDAVIIYPRLYEAQRASPGGPTRFLKDPLCAQKKTQRAHHAHAPWLLVWRMLAVVGLFWARSLAPLVLIPVLAF